MEKQKLEVGKIQGHIFVNDEDLFERKYADEIQPLLPPDVKEKPEERKPLPDGEVAPMLPPDVRKEEK